MKRVFLLFAVCLLSLSVSGNVLADDSDVAFDSKSMKEMNIEKIVIFPLNNFAGEYKAQELITPLLENSMLDRGYDVVPRERVNEFLLKRRIRNTSILNRSRGIEIKRELDADAVLIGSIDIFSATGDPVDQILNRDVVAGLTLRLISTLDCTILWMDTLSLAGSDFTGLLGFGKIKRAENLIERIIGKMTHNMPDTYSYEKVAPAHFEVGSIRLTPKVSNGGKPIKITARIVQLKESPLSVRLKIDGSEVELVKKGDTNIYQGTITAPADEGAYNLDLVAAGSSEDKIFASIAELRIDNVPPKVEIKTNQTTTGAGGTRETIIFTLIPYDKIERWEVHILNSDNKTVRWGKGYATLPSKVLWRGEDDFGRKNRDGEYSFQLSVWDEANNMAVYSKKIRLDSTPPEVSIDVESFGTDEVVFNFTYDKQESMDEWNFIVLSGDEEIVKKISGKGNISNRIAVKLPPREGSEEEIDENKKVIFSFKATDVAGNTFETTGEKLFFASKKWKKFSQKKSDEDWGVLDF